MKIELEIPSYNAEKGFIYHWENNFEISTYFENNQLKITANKEGLISLASHLLNLAQESVPKGQHLHFDEYNSLEEGSIELIIEKI